MTMLAFAWNPAVGLPLAIVGAIVLALIWLFGQPKKEQGRRRMPTGQGSGERREPTLVEGDADDMLIEDNDPRMHRDEPMPQQGELEIGLREELEKLGATLAGERSTPGKPSSRASSIIDALRAPSAAPAAVVPAAVPASTPAQAPAPAPKAPPASDLGRRPAQLPMERIVTLFVMARDGGAFNGADLIVAAEKAGLEYGHLGIYHRLLDGKREQGPIFSVANMLKPGNFDLTRLDALRTPGLSFFMTLPGPLPALDAWDAMLPTAQRLAELLDGQVLDEERNALGRQRIAHIRDELRGWDRDHEGKEIIFGR
ncbi:cell division protein ZipA [Frateuria terrea]|uniref:Cell division protein ZipA n=1 Tax=Frateuria terrea TaxID=529704 RepID=A0A1H6U8Q4_9GAMM|nr:cell division protein ZipA [Frateuria terrea]SEI87906.1 cell division protein ZipA [Frateuria terrea]SFP38014.1 cell division protein ZipA [Frateuria terrea]